MINKVFAFVFAAAVSVQSIAALNNPFDKTITVNAGASVNWDVKEDMASKTAPTSDTDGTFYQLRITRTELILRLLDSPSGGTISFDQLKIEDVQLDGKSSTLFGWCLNNQEEHNRFLQQGLKIEKDICQNKGQKGVFVMKLNQATYDLLKTTKSLAFTVKPYRSSVVASFDVSNIADIFVQLASGGRAVAAQKKPVAAEIKSVDKSSAKFLTKPISSTPALAAPLVKAKPADLCSIKPPLNFAALKVIEYVCTDETAKAKARKEMAANVKQQRAKKEKLALEKKQKLKQTEAERLAREEEERKEAEAVAASEQNRNKIKSQVSEKMIGMCKKKWAVGEHRCYCEPYLEFAPAGIKSDGSCGGG